MQQTILLPILVRGDGEITILIASSILYCTFLLDVGESLTNAVYKLGCDRLESVYQVLTSPMPASLVQSGSSWHWVSLKFPRID